MPTVVLVEYIYSNVGNICPRQYSGRIQILKALTDLNVTYNYFSCVMARAVDPDPDPRGFAVIFPP